MCPADGPNLKAVNLRPVQPPSEAVGPSCKPVRVSLDRRPDAPECEDEKGCDDQSEEDALDYADCAEDESDASGRRDEG